MASSPCNELMTNLKVGQLSVVTVTTEEVVTLLKSEQAALKAANCYYIGKESGLLPFLSVKDNLLVGISKKEERAYHQQILKWARVFKLTSQLATLYPNTLSEEMIILLHLVRALSLERKLILINTLALDSSLPFIDSLVPSLKKAASEKTIRIVLLTKQDALTN